MKTRDERGVILLALSILALLAFIVFVGWRAYTARIKARQQTSAYTQN